MKKSAFLPLAPLLALAATFAQPTFAQLGPACAPETPDCRNIKVTVQGNQVVLDPATLTVTGRRPPAVKMVWYLATPGYTFVDLPGNRPVNFPAAYFMSDDSRFCYMWLNDQVYISTDWNADPLDVNYTLRVMPASGGSPVTVTGRVVNN